MVKSRSGKQSGLIIKTKKHWIIELFIITSSILIWIYGMFALTFFISSIFDFTIAEIGLVKEVLNLNDDGIKSFLANIGLYALIMTALLLIWSEYNRVIHSKFLKEKKQISPLSSEEKIMNLDLITKEDYDRLQSSKRIVFERNPIKEK